MVHISTIVLPILATTTTVCGFTWTKCTNAAQCLQLKRTGTSSTGGTVTGGSGSFSYVGGYVTSYDTCSGFIYTVKDGYWYSKGKDGLFVSPTGYLRTAHDCNMDWVSSKSSAVGDTCWMKYGGGDCCLPDGVGTDILDVKAYCTGNN